MKVGKFCRMILLFLTFLKLFQKLRLAMSQLLRIARELEQHFDWLVTCVQQVVCSEPDLAVVTAEGGRVYTHRLLLAMHSPLLADILRTVPNHNLQASTLHLPISSSHLLHLLTILTTGITVTTNRAELQGVMAAAATLGFNIIKAKIGSKRKHLQPQQEDVKPKLAKSFDYTIEENSIEREASGEGNDEESYDGDGFETHEVNYKTATSDVEDKDAVLLLDEKFITIPPKTPLQDKLKVEIRDLETGLTELFEASPNGLADGNFSELISSKEREIEEKRKKLLQLYRRQQKRKSRRIKKVSMEGEVTFTTEKSKKITKEITKEITPIRKKTKAVASPSELGEKWREESKKKDISSVSEAAL